jgi:septation ring formation regulator EzrA
MGAWGTGVFDNDTACDWAYSLEESNDLSVVDAALEKVLATGSEYLEAPDSEEGLAAVEVVARLQGNFGEKNSYTETVDAWVGKNKTKVPPELAKKALATIERILSEPSEIVELWKESGEFDAWKSNIDNLKSRIRA